MGKRPYTRRKSKEPSKVEEKTKEVEQPDNPEQVFDYGLGDDLLSDTPVPTRPAEDFEREELIQKAQDVSGFAVRGNTVAMIVPDGILMAEVDNTTNGLKVVNFTYMPEDNTEKITFWFNADSVKWLGDLLRNSPNKRMSMETILG